MQMLMLFLGLMLYSYFVHEIFFKIPTLKKLLADSKFYNEAVLSKKKYWNKASEILEISLNVMSKQAWEPCGALRGFIVLLYKSVVD